jgi:hypothetical protein
VWRSGILLRVGQKEREYLLGTGKEEVNDSAKTVRSAAKEEEKEAGKSAPGRTINITL